jgi:signal transduction histidine kinase
VNGTGLGLAIAKWIADTHDAPLTVRSSELEGSVFTAEFHLIAPALGNATSSLAKLPAP